MALKVSQGLRDYMLATGSFKAGVALGFLKLYAGAVPADANAAVAPAVLLATISVNAGGTGLSFEAAAVSGVLSKAAAEVWQGVVGSSATCTFFRFVAVGDDGLLSTTQRRLQGTVALVGGDLNLSNVALTAASVQTINHFNVALPTL
jgi:hypothetical protein